MPERIVIEVRDEHAVDGVGFGGSPRDMRPVVLFGPAGEEIQCGYLSRQNWKGGGGMYEAFLGDGRSVYSRGPSMHTMAMALAMKKIQNTPTLSSGEGWQGD